MRRSRRQLATLLSVLSILALAAGVATAQVDICRLHATDSDPVVAVLVCPDGDGGILPSSASTTVRITLVDENGGGLDGIPPDRYYLGVDGYGAQDLCRSAKPLRVYADGPTVGGQTTITDWALAGAPDLDDFGYPDYIGLFYSEDDVIHRPFRCEGAIVYCTCSDPFVRLPIALRSVDFGGGSFGSPDGNVNLADLSLFATAYPPNPYNVKYDLNADGVVNLVDLSVFSMHMGYSCWN